MGNILHVGRHVARCAPGICTCHIESRASIVVSSGCCKLRLSRIIPFEDAIRANLLVEHGRQRRHFEVFVGSDEAAAVASSLRQCGECYHVASLQFERADAVVKLRCGQSIHVASAVFGAVVLARITLILLFCKDSQWLEAVSVRKDDAAFVPKFYLTIAIIDGCCAIYLYSGKPLTDGDRWFHRCQNDNGVFRIDDVYKPFVGKWCGVRNLKINFVGNVNLCRDCCDSCFPVGCHYAERQTDKDDKDVSLHGYLF